MILMKFTCLILLFGTCVSTALFCRADDAPQWGERHTRNPISTETGLPSSFHPGRRDPQTDLVDPATTRNVLWTAPIGEVLYGTPVVAEGSVLVGSNRTSLSAPALQGDKAVLSCLDEKTGQLRWELVVPKLTGIRYADWHRVGIAATPVVENGKVFLVTNRCEVLCLDLQGMTNGNQGPFLDEAHYAVPPGSPPIDIDEPPSGKYADILWRCDLIARLGVMPHNACNCSVLSDGDLLYVCTGNGVDWTHRRVMNPEAPTLVVLDKRDGTVLAVDDFRLGPNIIHGQWSSPALGVAGGRRLVVQGTGSGWLFAVEALTPRQIEELRRRMSKGEATAAVPLKLKTAWRFNGHPLAQTQEIVPLEHHHDTKSYEVIGNPVFLAERIYVIFTQELYHNVPDGRMVCLDATGIGDITRTAQVWSYEEITSSSSTVAVADGLVYVSDNGGKLHCLDAETGKPYWVQNLGGNQVWASPLLADGKIYIGTGRRIFWTLKQGRSPEILGRVALPGPMYASSVAANGVLYVPVFGTLYAVKASEGNQ